MQYNKNKFLGILVMVLALTAMVATAQAATWENTLVYTATTVTKYDVAVGDKLKGAADDTVRVVTTQSASPYGILISTDRSTALPMSWVTETVTNTVAMRGCAIGDVDGDGQNEIIIGQTSSPYGLKMVKWTGGAWVLTTVMTSTSSYVGSVYDIAIGDADNNSGTYNDIVFNTGSYGVMKARWNGATFDTTRICYNTAASTWYGVALGDFDAAYAGNEIVAVTYNQRVYRIKWNGATWDTTLIYIHPTDIDLMDVAVGDFDNTNPGAEIAINNGYGYATNGAVLELYGSGASWTLRALYSPATNWSTQGEIAVGDFFTTNPGAEIVAVSGGGAAYEARLVYGSGTTWYNEKVMGTGGSTYGVAVGNLNRYRPGNELAVGGFYKVWEAEQKLLTNDMSAISIDDMPSMVSTDEIKTLKVTVRNNAEYTAASGVPVKLKIDGPLSYVYTDLDQVTLTNIAPGGTEQIIFSPDWIVPDTLCSYTIKAWTEKASDEIPANDTVTKIVTVIRTGGIVESFTGTTFPPPGWTRFNFYSTVDDSFVRYTTYYNSAPASARCNYDLPNNDWLITPRLKAVDGDKLKFWWRAGSATYQETLLVRVSTNPNVSDTASYTYVDQVTGNSIIFTEKVVDLSSYAGQDIYIAFHYPAYDKLSVAIDDVSGPYFPPKIQVSPDSIYVESFPDSFFDIFFNIKNIGGGTLNYTNSLATPASWLTIIPTSGSVSSGMTDTDTLRFNTTGMDGHYYDTLVITSNSGEKATNLIPIHIWVRLIPDISVSPESLAVDVEGNGTKDTAIFISNSGNGNLEYTVETEEWSKSGAIFEGEPATRPHKMETNLEEIANIPEKQRPNMGWGTPPVKGQGGPDAFGYRWIDSDEAGGPTFSWIEINSIGTLLSITDDGNVGPYNIGFPFEFYGNTFTQFRVASNGFASFTSTVGNLTNDTIPKPSEPNNLLALMWDDLRSAYGGGAGNIYYHSNSERLVIEWDHVIRYGQTACPYTMEIILYPNGKIIYQYLQMGEVSCTYQNQATIGIENGTGTDGLEVVYNANYVHNNMAIRFSAAPSWLVFSPEFGSIPPSGSDTIDVTFDATGILSGDFYGAFIITSNDPDTPVETVPAHMHILVPDMTFTPASIETSGTEGQAPFDVTMDIGNAGAGKLNFNIVESVPWLSVSPLEDTIPSGDPASTITFTIDCTNLYAGSYMGTLKVYSNDPDLQPFTTYEVRLEVGPDPDIAVSPESVYMVIPGGFTDDTSMTISNTGDGHLVWGIAIEELGKGADTILYEGFESGTFPPTGWTVVNNDGGTQTWTDYTTYYHTGTHSTSCRWESSTLWNDDWLITPRITVGSNDSLSFWYRAYSATWPESLEIRLSTTTNNVSAFTTVLWVGSQIVNSTWEEKKIELGKYAKAQVYIAFVYKGLNEFRIYVDDISVMSYAGPWLTVDPLSDINDPHTNKNVSLHFSAIGYQEDMHARLWVTSNDPDESPVLVPVHMDIVGPEYSVSPPDTLVINALENQYTDGYLYLQNYGGQGPLIYKLTDPVAWLSETPDTSEVPIDEEDTVTVTVDGNQLIAGDYATKIFIQTNDFDEHFDTVVVVVHMGPPPTISWDPDSFRVLVPAGGVKDTVLTITNDGDGHLAFELATEETGPKSIAGFDRDRSDEILKANALSTGYVETRPVDMSSPEHLTVLGSLGPSRASAAGSSAKAIYGGDTVFVQWPHDPSDTWSFGNSDQGSGYKMHENFWGVTKPVKGIQWWGLCLYWTGSTWIVGNPNNLTFDIMFYSDPPGDHTLPTDLVCTYVDIVPTVVPTGIFFTTGVGTFEMYLFTGVELSSLCDLPEGWVSVQSNGTTTTGDKFLWASAKDGSGDDYSYQQGATTPGTLYDRGLIMFGGAAWLSVAPEADTVNPHSSTNVNVHFDATDVLGGDKYGDIVITSNVPGKRMDTVSVHMIVAGANYSVHPMELHVTVSEGGIATEHLAVMNTGGLGDLFYRMTWAPAWLTANPDTESVPPDGSQDVLVRVDATDLIAGDYYAEIWVKTNAANQQNDTIPVYVHVGPDPDIQLPVTSLDVRMNPGVNLALPFRVNNIGGGHLSFETDVESAKDKADVLLVDDDGSAYLTFTDARSYFTAALTANGYTYDVFEVMAAGADGPDATTMAGYPVVVWFTGECWQLSQTLTVNDENNLATYLDGGGGLFLSAQDYFWDRYSSLDPGNFPTSSFPYTHLGVTWTDQDVWYIGSPSTGSCVGIAGSLTDGMTFTLWDPYTTKAGGKGPDDGLFIDQLQHQGMNLFQMTNPTPTGIAACQYEALKGFRVVFTTVDFAGLTDGAPPSTKNELMRRIVEWLSGGGGGGGCPFTVTPEADTIAPTSYEDVMLDFDGTAFEACSEETLFCTLTFTTNDPDETTVVVPVKMWSGRGDVKPPGVLDLGDVVFLINFVLKGGPAPDPICMGDLALPHDGMVDMVDIMWLLQYLYEGGQAPLATPEIHQPNTMERK